MKLLNDIEDAIKRLKLAAEVDGMTVERLREIIHRVTDELQKSAKQGNEQWEHLLGAVDQLRTGRRKPSA
jgi:hypothetical protein